MVVMGYGEMRGRAVVEDCKGRGMEGGFYSGGQSESEDSFLWSCWLGFT